MWKSIRDDTTLIFQWESDSSASYLKKLLSDSTIEKVKGQTENFSYLKWFSFGNGLIRPACASYRDDVALGNFYNNHFKELDEFLAPTMGRVTMQEDIMQFLVKFCGYSQAESDNVRRGIAKKYGTEKLLPEIERRFIEYSSSNYEITKEQCAVVIKPFLEVILQASAYAFSWNHSDSYSCIGYICGYLRYYYPLEFLTASLNIFADKEDKTLSICNYAKKQNIPILSPKFGKSKGEYFMDKNTNSIYKGIGSIKFMNTSVANELYELSKNKYSTFKELFIDIKSTSINLKQLQILINLNYFSDYGDIEYLNYVVEIIDKFIKSKVISKSKLSEYEYKCLDGCFNKSTEKQFRDIDNNKFIDRLISNRDYKKTKKVELIKHQVNILGYSDIIIENTSRGLYCLESIEVNQWGTPWFKLYRICDGSVKSISVNRKWYKEYPCEVGDILNCVIEIKEKNRKETYIENKKEKTVWTPTGEYREVLTMYSKS